MVCRARQTFFQSAELDFCSGLDDAFRINGVFGVAHFAVAADFRPWDGTRAFFIQLALNASWSWMFFAAHSPPLGMINIVPQWLIIIATIVAFIGSINRSMVPLSVGGVGCLCGRSKSGDLAAE